MAPAGACRADAAPFVLRENGANHAPARPSRPAPAFQEINLNRAPQSHDPLTVSSDDVSTIISSFAAALEDPRKPLALLAEFHVRQGTQDLVEAAFADIREPTAAESGVIAFELHRERREPTRFVVYERWRSLADLEAHLRTPYIRALRRLLDGLMVGVPEFRILTPTPVVDNASR